MENLTKINENENISDFSDDPKLANNREKLSNGPSQITLPLQNFMLKSCNADTIENICPNLEIHSADSPTARANLLSKQPVK